MSVLDDLLTANAERAQQPPQQQAPQQGALQRLQGPASPMAPQINQQQQEMLTQAADYLKKQFDVLPSLQEAARAANEKYRQALTPETQQGYMDDLWDKRGFGANFAAGMRGIDVDMGAPGNFLKGLQQFNIGQHEARQNFEANTLKELGLASKNAQDEYADGEKRALDAQNRLTKLHGDTAGEIIHMRNDQGDIILLNKKTGEMQILPASGAKAYDEIYKKNLDYAVKNKIGSDLNEAMAWARQATQEALSNRPGSVAPTYAGQPPMAQVTTGPAMTRGLPPTAGAPSQEATTPTDDTSARNWVGGSDKTKVAMMGLTPEQMAKQLNNIPKDDARAILEQLPPEQVDTLRRIVARMKANPDNQPLQENSRAAIGKVISPQYLNVRKEERDKALGKTEGTTSGNMIADLHQTGMAADNLRANLGVLKTLIEKHGDSIPEGAGANLVSDIRSGLSTFGIKFDGQGVTDALSAMMSKEALASRTADGNLLPGSMSNYEVKLIQSTMPALSQTSQGRMLMIQIIDAQLKMKSDLANAARQYVRQHGSLDDGWYDKAAELAKSNPYLNPTKIAAMEEYSKRIGRK